MAPIIQDLAKVDVTRCILRGYDVVDRSTERVNFIALRKQLLTTDGQF